LASYRRDIWGKQVSENAKKPKRSRRISGIIGAFLLALALVWLIWLVIHRLGGGTGISLLPIPGLSQATPTVGQIPPLTAAGISLGTPSSPPALTQQQALLIADQLESDAATNAQKTSARYVLLNFDGAGAATQHAITNEPAWMVLYLQIPQQPADPSSDPSQSLPKQHDLYVFLDANSGKELLAIWT
jgi:hypothetical protein